MGAASGALWFLSPKPQACGWTISRWPPTAQGSGFGGRLLAFAEDAARQAGYRVIRLYTNAAMTENIARYLRIGYVETRRDGEKGFRRVYMEKQIG
jgi:hypothetical protein